MLPSARGKLFKLFINFHPLIRKNNFPNHFQTNKQKERREMIAKKIYKKLFSQQDLLAFFWRNNKKKGYFMALVVTQIETGRKVFSYRHTARGHILNN